MALLRNASAATCLGSADQYSPEYFERKQSKKLFARIRTQCSRYECIRSRFSIEPLRNIGTRLVNHHRNIVSLSDQLPVAALYHLTAVLFRLDHDQELVHESSHPPCGTRLGQRGHVKNNVVEVAGF